MVLEKLKEIKEAGAIIESVVSRFRRGRVNSILVFGHPGTGKSWACIRLGELISIALHGENRMTSDRIVDNMFDLVRVVKDTKRKGEILVIEEVSVLFSSRRSMASDNVDAGRIFDTIRKKGIIVLMNCPIGGDVDKKLTRLSSMSVQTMSLNKRDGICILKPLRLQTNPGTGKTYTHRLWSEGKEVFFSWSGKPNEKTCEEYEQSKDKFLEELYKSMFVKREKEIEKEKKKMGDLTDLNTPGVLGLTDNEKRRWALREKGFTLDQISKLERVSISAVADCLRKARGKMKKTKENLGFVANK